MKYFVLFVLAAIAAWYFFFRDAGTVPLTETRVVRVTPDKQFATLFSSSPVDAGRLAALCQAYPQLGAQVLRNREFRIHGRIRDFRLTGMDGRRADVMFHSDVPKVIVVNFNLDQYFRTYINQAQGGRYTIVDTELLWVNPAMGGSAKKLLFAKETEIEQVVAMKSFGATNITFTAVQSAPTSGSL